MMNSYGIFAKYYDILTQDIPYAKRGEYFHALCKKYGVSSGILLDLACGTGSLSEVFAELGYDVIGVDGSEAMLGEAVKKRALSGRDILYLCQDLTEIDLYGTIDVCVCALDSVNHLIDQEDLQAAFERVSLFLNPGGLFIFDVNTLYKHETVLSGNSFVYEYDDIYCVWQNSDCEEHIIDICLDLFVPQGNGIYRRDTEQFSERAYSHEELLHLLDAAGLTLLDCFEDGRFSPPAKTCERSVYIAGSRK